jgi:hypothetical protein
MGLLGSFIGPTGWGLGFLGVFWTLVLFRRTAARIAHILLLVKVGFVFI